MSARMPARGPGWMPASYASGRRFARTGIWRRTAATRSRSRSARTIATDIGRLGDDRAPRIDDHRTAERRLAGRSADLRRGEDVRGVLDRPRPEQHLPVVAPGALREVGRDGQDRRAGQRERAVELGEAQVVADRQADRGAVDRGRDQPVAGRHPGRLGVDRTGLDRDVEQVDLAVPRGDRSVRGDQHGRVVRAVRVAARLGRAADQDPGIAPARHLGERRPCAGPGSGRAEAR